MAIAPTLVIDVIDPTGQSHRVIGHAATIIAYVLADAEFLNSLPVGRLNVHFAESGSTYEATKVVRR